jgi:glutamate N-acetyltransferase / amino-acid N-acetyltransferase
MSDAVTLPQLAGFRFATLAAGIKKPGKLDLGLIYSDVPARCAGVFTTNKVVAAPVTLTAPRIKRQLCQAILVNSGNANACTGELGFRDAGSCGQQLADALGIDAELVAVASTGVIGKPLPMDKFAAAIPQLPERLAADGARQLAESIMTTDSFAKLSTQSGEVQGAPYQILGIAKGAGMIHPNMATMLAFVATDAPIESAELAPMLNRVANRSFNCISVDGDTSTNDTLYVLSSGLGLGHVPLKDTAVFEQALTELCIELAQLIVRDGEGVSKFVTIEVAGAASEADARTVGRAVAISPLVKTAFAGSDANWGRILSAVGNAGVGIDPDHITLSADDVLMFAKGNLHPDYRDADGMAVFAQDEFSIHIDLGMGTESATVWTGDLTHEYIVINAEYRT